MVAVLKDRQLSSVGEGRYISRSRDSSHSMRGVQRIAEGSNDGRFKDGLPVKKAIPGFFQACFFKHCLSTTPIEAQGFQLAARCAPRTQVLALFSEQ